MMTGWPSTRLLARVRVGSNAEALIGDRCRFCILDGQSHMPKPTTSTMRLDVANQL